MIVIVYNYNTEQAIIYKILGIYSITCIQWIQLPTYNLFNESVVFGCTHCIEKIYTVRKFIFTCCFDE